ncbi:MAG: lysostaphin resistance A-like protein [Flavobacteriales bacterium]
MKITIMNSNLLKEINFENQEFKISYSGVFFFIGIFLLGLLVSGGLSILLNTLELSKELFNSVFIFLNIIPFVMPIIYFLMHYKERHKFNFIPTKHLPLLIILSFFLMFCISFLAELIPYDEGILKKWYDLVKSSFEGLMHPKWAFVTSVCIFAPVFEELFLRGILLRGLINKATTEKEVWKAIVFTAFIFGLIHMNPWQFIAAFVGGIVLGYVYYRTKSLGNSIFIHALNNGVSTYLIFKYGEAEMVKLIDHSENDLLYMILALIGLVVSLYFVYFFTRKNIK